MTDNRWDYKWDRAIFQFHYGICNNILVINRLWVILIPLAYLRVEMRILWRIGDVSNSKGVLGYIVYGVGTVYYMYAIVGLLCVWLPKTAQ